MTVDFKVGGVLHFDSVQLKERLYLLGYCTVLLENNVFEVNIFRKLVNNIIQVCHWYLLRMTID